MSINLPHRPSHRPNVKPPTSRARRLLPPPLRTVQRTSPAPSGPPRQPSSGHVSSQLAPPWPFNPQETALIRAGYRPAFKPDTAKNADSTAPEADSRKHKKRTMAEPRARAARHKGQMNFAAELRLLLLAYGDPSPHPSFPSEPLPETVRVLDEIVTDFVLEMCHGAAQYAAYSRRQKIKVDDFRFALRRDPNKLGRVQELLRMERELKEARKAFDQNDDQVGNLKDASKKELEDLGEGTDGKKSKGKGKRNVRRDSDATEDTTVSKKRKTG
ncbi:putative transcription initiation factor TFIID subunit 13 [Aspergillus pseudotamarii]|uniref:Transcription initiation factor TFIID subunit 13 n=1 Tax=Aspergillus pseudotamarii TaxID=132259 RepID=A0A5N6SQV4_ASPPS|nr:putative transcription initiation factor TFIID subunit 13 [Aspergillus pseudotamarii]KAE8136199.1 putative transcription initiation factor TFIID subunit 13 [Aspergillus pseudotamarii]